MHNLKVPEPVALTLGSRPCCVELKDLKYVGCSVQQEESRRNVMLHTPIVEKAGLVASSTEKAKPANTSSNKDHLHCDYCGKSRHTRETCWKLHGRPNQSRGKRGGSMVRGQAHLADGIEVSETSLAGGLSNEELEALRRFSQRDSASTLGASNLAKTLHDHLCSQ
ncbi:hypothetical protein K2173_002460 [Erythroxylum novogranatense]|uniref:Uncharacterized protein n=1 Tax=Erythroxylum novogranatense TaxID=1862640 RepID=A0AAV8TA66_9ROSI|nr:hypothetical protein K2173_002460 [Erythroxylum novogranatense]